VPKSLQPRVLALLDHLEFDEQVKSCVLFLIRQEKYQKKPRKGALRADRAPFTIPRRIAIQCSKMFRFLNTCIVQDWKFALQRPLKIGTFSAGGG